jgi:hypothetical protein
MRFGEARGRVSSRKGWKRREEREGKGFWGDFGQQNNLAATDWCHRVFAVSI